MSPAGTGWLRRALMGTLPLLIGLGAFLLITGGRVVWPDNIAWLQRGDPATHYLGWLYFRASPWQWPVGLNPDYGLELASTIVYADAIPLLALGFKTFSPWLPQPFQYFGLWLLGCFVLQAWFGWLLVGLVQPACSVRALGTAFFAFAPAMLWRLHPQVGHLSLAGHFLVLAALYLVLRPSQRQRVAAWGSLLAVAALTHAYLLTLVGLLWLTDLLQRHARGALANIAAAGELVGLGLLVVLLCWQAGYFGVGAAVISGGYGQFGMNALALLDPSHPGYGSWSRVLPDLPSDPLQHEGFLYLGLGPLLLLPLALLAAWRSRQASSALALALMRRQWGLLVLLVVLTLVALTHHLHLSHHTLALPLAPAWQIVLGIWRASARLFWPVYYIILLLILVQVARGYRAGTACGLLALALGLQLLDTQAGWSVIRQHLMQPAAARWSTPLQSSFWDQAAWHYRVVRSIPSGTSPHWSALADYAARHHLRTDAAYLARMSEAGILASAELERQVLQHGRYATDTLYVLDEAAAAQVRRTLDPRRDCLARIDGLQVLAPGWPAHSPPFLPCPASAPSP